MMQDEFKTIVVYVAIPTFMFLKCYNSSMMHSYYRNILFYSWIGKELIESVFVVARNKDIDFVYELKSCTTLICSSFIIISLHGGPVEGNADYWSHVHISGNWVK